MLIFCIKRWLLALECSKTSLSLFCFSKLFNSSEDVANHMRVNLLENLEDIISWQSNIAPPRPISSLPQEHAVQSSLPEWLQDHLINSLSFWRSGFRVADGR